MASLPNQYLLMSLTKLRVSFWQIWNMSFGFLRIQYSFRLQQSAVNPIYSFLGAKAKVLTNNCPTATTDGMLTPYEAVIYQIQ